jgi:hypothetical protein
MDLYLLILSVLVKGSTTVFYIEAATLVPQPSAITAVHFNLIPQQQIYCDWGKLRR